MKSPLLAAIAERALKTFAQTLVATIGVDQANLFAISLVNSLELAVSAAVLSVLSSVASMRFGKNGPSLTSEQVVPEEVKGH